MITATAPPPQVEGRIAPAPPPANKPAAERWVCFEKVLSVSVAAPAVRMVLVGVSVGDDGKAIHDLLPVVGLESRVRQVWGRNVRGNAYAPRSGSALQLRRCGWCLEEQDVERAALVLDPTSKSGELVKTTDPWITASYCATQLVACTWPPSQDAKRLSRVVEELIWSARERAP